MSHNSEGEYLPSVRQVVQDLRSFGVGVKHIGQIIQTVLKHLVGIEGVKVPSESSNRRMILESNLLAKLQVGEKMLSHGLNTLHFDGCPEDFKGYLASKDKLCKLKKFEHNRFNVIFENAGAVVYHKDDIIDFLSKLSSMNMLQRSVLSDLKDENIYQ